MDVWYVGDVEGAATDVLLTSTEDDALGSSFGDKDGSVLSSSDSESDGKSAGSLVVGYMLGIIVISWKIVCEVIVKDFGEWDVGGCSITKYFLVCSILLVILYDDKSMVLELLIILMLGIFTVVPCCILVALL